MKITFDWLKDHLKTNLKENNLLEQLTNIGLEVESVENLSADNDLFKIPQFIDELKDTFQVFYNEDLRLYTIRNYTQNEVDKLLVNKDLILYSDIILQNTPASGVPTGLPSNKRVVQPLNNGA